MKLIVDANILFSFFWKDCFTKRLLVSKYFELFAPEFSLEELGKYKADIMKKTGVNSDEFDKIRRKLVLYVEFVSFDKYKYFLKKAVDICPDSNDIDYFALALKEDVSIWTNDKKLKEQNAIDVLNTMDVVELMK